MRHLESIILFFALVFIWVPFIFSFFIHSIRIKIWKFLQIYCSLPPSLTVPSFHWSHVKNMMINSVNDQGIEGSSSCDGCDCPQIIRLNPDKDSNTTVVTSPRNFLSWWGLVMILMMISYYDLDDEVCANVLLCFAASRISTQRTRTASGSSMWVQETCFANIKFIWSFKEKDQRKIGPESSCMDLIWYLVFQATKGKLKLTFNKFKTEWSSNCKKDYLFVGNVSGAREKQPLPKQCIQRS